MGDLWFGIEELNSENLEQASVLFDAYRRFYEQPSDVPAALDFLTARFLERSSDCWVARAEATGELVGFCQCYRTFSSVRTCGVLVLNDLYVTSNSRGLGVGRCLVSGVIEHAQRINVGYISLETARDNASAQALYRSLGFDQASGFVEMIKEI